MRAYDLFFDHLDINIEWSTICLNGRYRIIRSMTWVAGQLRLSLDDGGELVFNSDDEIDWVNAPVFCCICDIRRAETKWDDKLPICDRCTNGYRD